MSLEDELRAESKRLRAEIQKLVGPLQRRLELVEELLASKESKTQAEPDSAGFGGHSGPLAGKGLREAIVIILSDLGKGKPSQVTRMLESRGYPDEGDAKTPLGTRVGNEMWRMAAKEETLDKNKSGEYWVAEKES